MNVKKTTHYPLGVDDPSLRRTSVASEAEGVVCFRCMQRLVREHLAPSSQMSQSDHAVSDLIVTIVKVMQPRLTPMNPELRKLFIQILMVSLIEKTTDSKASRS